MEFTFSVKDFILSYEYEYKKTYVTDRKCLVLNKIVEPNIFVENHFIISLHKNKELSEYIPDINKYIEWFNGKFKNDLLKYFCKFHKNYCREKCDINYLIKTKWYEELIVYGVAIMINIDGKITSYIICEDKNNKTHFLNILIIEHEIYLMEYEYKGESY